MPANEFTHMTRHDLEDELRHLRALASRVLAAYYSEDPEACQELGMNMEELAKELDR